MDHNFPCRQTHLDFHTSPDIPGIGSRFSKENFQAALKKGKLESITVFAKCHHSMCYYPTDIGIRHPHLDFDLTGAMVEAAHEIGVRAPIYITAGWSNADAINHPQWRSVTKEGTYAVRGGYDFSAGPEVSKPHASWQLLCLNDGPYAQHIYALTEEICKRYAKVDGLFYDICFVDGACYCQSCKKGMREMGLDPEKEADARQYYIRKRQDFMTKCAQILNRYHPGATIFFNSGGADQDKPQYHDYSTHFEMEDLPTAWGGYDKLPLRAKYFSRKGKPMMAMTGKFHLDWGEFGGFKSAEALKFEIASMALYGAGASVGDHMHPDGEMEMQTYENIGYAYDYLERIAPYCYGGQSTADVGICLCADSADSEGLSNILLQNQIDYDIIADNNFAEYDTVIIPQRVTLDHAGLSALKAYLERGGKLVLMGDALVKDGQFQIDTGLKYLGAPQYECDYLIPPENRPDLPAAPMLCNIPGHRTEVNDAAVFAEFITPYFDRTYGHFCGHKNTPHDKSSRHFPAIAKKGNIIYLSHSLGAVYFQYGSVFHKRYFMYALGLVYGQGRLSVQGLGSQGRCTMIHQPQQHRYCINMVYASPVRRGSAEIIEDILPVYNIRLDMQLAQVPKRVYLPLTGQELAFTEKHGRIQFTVPELQCHAAVVIEYEAASAPVIGSQ